MFCTTNKADGCKQRKNIAKWWLTWDMKFVPIAHRRPRYSAPCCDDCKAAIGASVQKEKGGE